jgi:hypothetical protein
MVAGEGRPKRACADGIDYAGTDQVPGWTVRVSFLFFAFLFFCFVWERNFKIFLSPPLSLSVSAGSLSSSSSSSSLVGVVVFSLLFARMEFYRASRTMKC